MKINDYVLVTKKDSDLYRRRCQIIEITDDEKYKVYSEGLEQDEILPESELEPSKWPINDVAIEFKNVNSKKIPTKQRKGKHDDVELIVTNVYNENTDVTALDIVKKLILSHIDEVTQKK